MSSFSVKKVFTTLLISVKKGTFCGSVKIEYVIQPKCSLNRLRLESSPQIQIAEPSNKLFKVIRPDTESSEVWIEFENCLNPSETDTRLLTVYIDHFEGKLNEKPEGLFLLPCEQNMVENRFSTIALIGMTNFTKQTPISTLCPTVPEGYHQDVTTPIQYKFDIQLEEYDPDVEILGLKVDSNREFPGMNRIVSEYFPVRNLNKDIFFTFGEMKQLTTRLGHSIILPKFRRQYESFNMEEFPKLVDCILKTLKKTDSHTILCIPEQNIKFDAGSTTYSRQTPEKTQSKNVFFIPERLLYSESKTLSALDVRTKSLEIVQCFVEHIFEDSGVTLWYSYSILNELFPSWDMWTLFGVKVSLPAIYDELRSSQFPSSHLKLAHSLRQASIQYPEFEVSELLHVIQDLKGVPYWLLQNEGLPTLKSFKIKCESSLLESAHFCKRSPIDIQQKKEDVETDIGETTQVVVPFRKEFQQLVIGFVAEEKRSNAPVITEACTDQDTMDPVIIDHFELKTSCESIDIAPVLKLKKLPDINWYALRIKQNVIPFGLTNYSTSNWYSLGLSIEHDTVDFTPLELIYFQDCLFQQMLIGRSKAWEYLAFVQHYKHQRHPYIWLAITENISKLIHLMLQIESLKETPENMINICKFGTKLCNPILKDISMDRRADDSEDICALRQIICGFLTVQVRQSNLNEFLGSRMLQFANVASEIQNLNHPRLEKVIPLEIRLPAFLAASTFDDVGYGMTLCSMTMNCCQLSLMDKEYLLRSIVCNHSPTLNGAYLSNVHNDRVFTEYEVLSFLDQFSKFRPVTFWAFMLKQHDVVMKRFNHNENNCARLISYLTYCCSSRDANKEMKDLLSQHGGSYKPVIQAAIDRLYQHIEFNISFSENSSWIGDFTTTHDFCQ